MQHDSPRRWRVFGATVRGAAHRRKDLPNQDRIRWWPHKENGSVVILAAADGHGSARSFRSHIGADLAVNAAMDVARRFIKAHAATRSLSTLKRTAEERMPLALAQRWGKSVDSHLCRRPLAPEELDALERSDGLKARGSVEENKRIAYGSTLLVVVLGDAYLMALQLGDGDILTVSEAGEVSRPLPADSRLMGNETTSLCSPEAWRDFRFGFQVLAERPPAMVLMSTDGLANSYRDPEGFLQLGRDLCAMIRADGIAAVERQVPFWLEEATARGSGDDVTLGLAVRSDSLLMTPEPVPATQDPAPGTRGPQVPDPSSSTPG